MTVRNMGRFIGKMGANIRGLQASTHTLIYQFGVRNNGQYIVFYDTPAAFNAERVRAAA